MHEQPSVTEKAFPKDQATAKASIGVKSANKEGVTEDDLGKEMNWLRKKYGQS